MQLWGWLACAKSAGRPSWLESPGRADVAVISPKTQNSFFFGGVSVFLLKPLIDWLRPTHIVGRNGLNELTVKINHHNCAFQQLF